jgi:hypothetical protein
MRATEVIRKRKIAIPLAIIITISVILLTGFTLMHETQTPETVIGEAVTWEIERPTDIFGPMNEIVENTYSDDGCSILFNVSIPHYDDSDWRWGGSASLFLDACMEANVSEGFVDGLSISFNENYNWSQIDVWKDTPLESENLETRSVVDCADKAGWTGGLGESLKGCVAAVGVKKPGHVCYRISVDWILQSPQNQSHSMEASLQLTYNNGTTLKEVILPVVLKVASDAGDTLETAKEIGFGNYTGWHHILIDPEDFYKVWMEEGKTVKIQFSQKPPLGTIFDLYLYNTSCDLVASSCSKIRNHIEEITYTINQTGWWYIQVVNSHAGFGLYTLSIQEAEPQ